jgi:hypothetical protein
VCSLVADLAGNLKGAYLKGGDPASILDRNLFVKNMISYRTV